MSESSEMDQPVTRRELREELANFPTKAELREELANFPTKAELREELGSLKAEIREEFATKLELQNMTKLLLREMGMLEHRIVTTLRDDFRHYFRAYDESMRSQISAIDEKYADLPARVTALEAKRKRR